MTEYEKSPDTLRSIAHDGILTDNTSPVVAWAAGEIERQWVIIRGLCDRLDRIDNIAHDDVMQHDEKVRQISEWSGGFSPLPATQGVNDADVPR